MPQKQKFFLNTCCKYYCCGIFDLNILNINKKANIDMGMLQRNNNRRGFTIVELSVVMVVLGILAGIVIVSVSSWRTSAARKEVQSDLNGVIAGMSAARNFNNGYPTALPSSFTASPNVQLTYVSGDASGYCVDGKSKVTASATYFIDTVRTGGTPRFGSCAMGQIPENTPTGPGWDSAIAGTSHKCGVASGKAYCWGVNTYGQLGNNTFTTSNTPVPVDVSGVLNGKTVTAIEPAADSTCAIADGAVYCWGRNDKNELGSNTVGASSKIPLAMNTLNPTGVLAGKTVTSISGAGHHYCAIANGAIYCWGDNSSRQLGNGTTAIGTVPTAVDTSGVMNGKMPTAVAASYEETCALASGEAFCWGSGNKGQHGSAAYTNYSAIPRAVDMSGVLSGKTITAIAGHNFTFCALASGQVYCWGGNDYGLFGNGDGGVGVQSLVPVPAMDPSGVLSGKTITALTVAGGAVCVIASGDVYCSGDNWYGQLGNNVPVHDVNQSTKLPVAVDMTGALNGKTVTSLDRGYGSICAAVGTEAYCWGAGSLGNGTATDSSSPIRVNAP